ncbi:hypothetical protein [Ktedonospora formicarum]|uniref:Uncharacterized protein n=1 Tax=Ktedonospora formicarum TaxID=2778364 RepID=A0A8J3IAE8_9CHLR|nr:hypothetical protein [Ktedonospora formicarum]GHO50243.1 hypothetical protein KSX_84060 [Ktedonospora formicarum]
MTALLLTLCWLITGLLLGLLCYLARLRPRTHASDWYRLALVGALFASLGGWIAVPLLGYFFATGVAIWCAITACLFLRFWIRLRSNQRAQTQVS